MPAETYAARPTIQINGQQYALVNELALSVEMAEQEGGLSSLEVRLSNVASDLTGGATLAFEDDRILKLGAQIALYAGDQTGPTEIFRGAISALELEIEQDQPPELVVLAEDLFQQARLERRTQSYRDVSIADLAANFASQLGLTPVITGFDANIGVQVQLNESDLAFMRRLLARYDGDMQVVGAELHVSPRSEVRRGALTLEMHNELRRVRVTADLAHQTNAVTVAGWDAAAGRRINVTSNGGTLGPGAGCNGSQVLQNALTERNHHVAHMAVETEDEAQSLADALYSQAARRFLRLDATAEGNAALRVGTNVTVRGLGARFDNSYYVTATLHRWDTERGYETDFQAECAFWGGR